MMKIAILGAGVGGLSTAIALKQKGFDVEVFERHHGRTHIGAGIVCWPNATFVLQQLGMLDDIIARSGATIRMQRLSSAGENLGALDVTQLNIHMGYGSYAILRRDLMQVLEQHALQSGVAIYYRHKVMQIQRGQDGLAEVVFEHGLRIQPDIIIAADGRMQSQARLFVHGDNQPIYQGFINWVGVFEGADNIFAELAVQDYWGVGQRFGIVPISHNRAYWAGGVAQDVIGERDPKKYKTELLELFARWPEPIATIIQDTALEDINKIYVHDHNPIDSWYRDNVLLIGDAAHAPLPTSGQGACQALEDAWHLGELMGRHQGEWQQVCREFYEIRKVKTAGITMGARQLASALFNTDAEHCRQRDSNSKDTDYAAMARGMAQGWASGLPLAILS